MNAADKHWHSPVQEPLVVQSAADLSWDQEADLVVVGFGGAGATTALRATECGLSALVIDRNTGGGATLASGGVVYAGGGTNIQKETGEQDTPENMFNYLKQETKNIVQDETLMRFCRNSADNLEWLMKQGVPFSGPVWKKKNSYPNVQYFLYHPDNSLLPDYAKQATPAARGHRGVARNGRSAVDLGGAVYWPLRDQCQKQGVAIHLNTEARQLVTDGAGQVLGVRALRFPPGSAAEAEHTRHLRRGQRMMGLWPFFLPGAKWVHKRAARLLAKAEKLKEEERVWISLRARKAVCLTSGGFIFNRAMVKHYCPDFADGMPLGTQGDDGS
ncbi:MAG: FAD-dependent oxidoreductase, partial [Pseudomonadales bacterium]